MTVLGLPDDDPVPMGTCRAHFRLAAFWLIVDAWLQTSGSTHRGALPIPNSTVLQGVYFALQNVHLTPAGQPRDWSNGVFAVLGR